MKKILIILSVLLAFLYVNFLFSNDTEVYNISKLSNWSFQYNSSSNDYSLFFAILDDKDKPVKAELDIEMRIVNSNNQEVYNSSKKVNKEDYGYYKSLITEELHLANIKIAHSEIEKGSSTDGTIYFKLYKDGELVFKETECKITGNLPIKEAILSVGSLPLEFNIRDYSNTIKSRILIEDILCTFEAGYIPYFDIVISGIKTYGNSMDYDMLRYKVYDKEGYVIDSGTIMLNQLTEGDKFKDNSLKIYDIIPGEEYTLELMEYSWN